MGNALGFLPTWLKACAVLAVLAIIFVWRQRFKRTEEKYELTRAHFTLHRKEIVPAGNETLLFLSGLIDLKDGNNLHTLVVFTQGYGPYLQHEFESPEHRKVDRTYNQRIFIPPLTGELKIHLLILSEEGMENLDKLPFEGGYREIDQLHPGIELISGSSFDLPTVEA